MTWALILFIIGLLGFILNRKNVILMLVSIEIMLLAVTLIILISSIAYNDNIGQVLSLFIIALAGAESAIGLSILIVYFKLTGAVSLINNIDGSTVKNTLKGTHSDRTNNSNVLPLSTASTLQ